MLFRRRWHWGVLGTGLAAASSGPGDSRASDALVPSPFRGWWYQTGMLKVLQMRHKLLAQVLNLQRLTLGSPCAYCKTASLNSTFQLMSSHKKPPLFL
jgi:hypothetical protein